MSLAGLDRDTLDELAPVVRRAVALDARAVTRWRAGERGVAVLVRLPFGVLVARTIRVDAPPADVTVGGREFLAWFDGETVDEPPRRDVDWRGGVPPTQGWTRIDTVPDGVV